MNTQRYNLNLPVIPPSGTILFPPVELCPIEEYGVPCAEPLNPTWPSVTIKGHDSQGNPFTVTGYRACWLHLVAMGLVQLS